MTAHSGSAKDLLAGFAMSSQTGLFVTVDGPNAVGKSSLVSAITLRLLSRGLDVLQTGEPTSSALGKLVREAEEYLAGRALACLVAADRYAHLAEEVRPALADGKVVLCDRYVESSFVLQALDGVEADFIWAVNSHVLVPDLSIVVNASPRTLDKRLSCRPSLSRFERTNTREQELALYQQAIAYLEPHGFHFLAIENDATPLSINVEQMCRAVQTLLKRRVSTGIEN